MSTSRYIHTYTVNVLLQGSDPPGSIPPVVIFYIYLTFTRLQKSVYAAQRIFLTSLRVNELVAHHTLDPLSTPTKTHTTTKPPSKSRKQHYFLPTYGPWML